MKLLKVIAAAAVFVSGAAQADWQYTKWGMTPAQVAAASKGAVNIGSGDPGKHIEGLEVGATGTYTSGEFTFSATFYFKVGKLVEVSLDEVGGDPYALKNSLDGVYGKPFSTSHSSVFDTNTYHDTAKNNRIDFLLIGAGPASLMYRPLKDRSAPGL